MRETRLDMRKEEECVLDGMFEDYYEDRLEGPDPDGMREQHEGILNALGEAIGHGTFTGSMADDVMEHVSLYGMEAEKTGFLAGFRMAWGLFQDMGGRAVA